MSFIKFDESRDIVSTKIDTPNTEINISTSAIAAASSLWVFSAQVSATGFLSKPDFTAVAPTNVPVSSAFMHIANYFFGTSTTISDSYDGITPQTSIRVIQLGRPQLDEGFYPNSITCCISATNFAITAIDSQNINSINSPLGLTGSFINSSNTADVVGTVFYDHGVIVIHGGAPSSTALISSTSGFAISSDYLPANVTLTRFTCKTRNILKRTIYFCRAYNTEMNFTTNPTARTTDGYILNSLTSEPTTFITTIGLYDDFGNLLAIGKLNPAKKKTFSSEGLFSVRLDF
jgi:hypothetical protein